MSLSSITREDLYKLVWEKPIPKLAEELNINSTELRERCKKIEIEHVETVKLMLLIGLTGF